MSELKEDKNSDNYIVGYLIFLVYALAVFKMLGVLNISWVVVFSPLWIPFVISIIALVIIIIITLIIAILKIIIWIFKNIETK